MSQKGFTLVELVLVVAILMTLLSIATYQFGRASKKSSVEAQTRELHAEITAARSEAMYRRTIRSVRFYEKEFAVHANDDASGASIMNRKMKHVLTWSGSLPYVVFDERGLLTGEATKTVCLETAGSRPVIDSIVIGRTSVQIGSKNSGAACTSANIVLK